MADRLRRAQYPWWVKMGLWGLPNRPAVWGFVWLSVALAAVVPPYMFWAGYPRWPAGFLFLLAALAYWQTIRWVDRNGEWQEHDGGQADR
jgi:hypothetical protein